MRYVVQHPNETRPSLLVEVVPEASAESLERVRSAMLAAGCANALVIDPHRVHVLRDTFRDMTAEAIVEDVDPFDTALLLGDSGELGQRTRRWLEAMSANWSEILPHEEWAASLLYDIVPAVSGSLITTVESDAA